MKECKRCKISKELTQFYKHKQMPDGYLNICKECKKIEAKDNYNKNILNPEFLENEKIRGREKYKRLSKNWKKPSNENRKKATNNFKRNFPEKYKAYCICSNLDKLQFGFNRHHWSYNKEHYKDTIKISVQNHSIIHRFLIYDQEYYMYRTMNNILLDTKQKHLEYINEILNSNITFQK